MSLTENADAPDDVRLEQLLADSEASLASGDHHAGAEQAAGALTLAERQGRREREARAASLLGIHRFRLGEHEASLNALHRELGLYTELGDLTGVSAALNGMAMAYYALGLNEDALEASGRSLEAAKRSGDARALAWAYNRAGLAHASVGNLPEGIISLEFALSLARDIGDQEAVFAAINNLIEDINTMVRQLLDEHALPEAEQRLARALELGPEALAFARASDNPYEEAVILVTYGPTLALAGRLEEALAALDESRRLAERGGYRPLVLEARSMRAQLELDHGRYGEAVQQFRALLEELDPEGDGSLLVSVHRGLWLAHKAREEFREALHHHERYHELERAQQSELANTRARVLGAHLELDRAQLAARQATLEAELERSRTRELEAQADALREERELLSRRADQDGLTGLWNRRHVERELPRLVREAAVRSEPLSVAFVDADKFKSINDRFGHLAGDDVLRGLAEILLANVRPTDVVARLGGEEFVVLLPGAAAPAALHLGQRLCDTVREADFTGIAPECRPTVSVGVATAWPTMPATGDVELAVADLLGRADAALYEAKRAGRDRVAVAQA